MINFAVSEKPAETKTDQVRRMVMGITSAILVMYIVTVAGFAGWRWYMEGKEEAEQKDIQGLTEQVNTKSTTEIVIRKLDARSKTVKDFLNNRTKVYSAAEKLENPLIKVKTWHFDAGIQTAELAASSTATLEDFANSITESYSSVQLNQSKWDPVNGWVSTVRLAGGKL